MLGDRRSNSLFAEHAVPAVPEAKPEQAEVHNISFEEDTDRTLFAENTVAPKASDVFFAPKENGLTFGEVLNQVQSYLSGHIRHPDHRGQRGVQGADEAPYRPISAGTAHGRGRTDPRRAG